MNKVSVRKFDDIEADLIEAEFAASSNVPARLKAYEAWLNTASPELAAVLGSIDSGLDKAIELCHNEVDEDRRMALMRCRYVLGMD